MALGIRVIISHTCILFALYVAQKVESIKKSKRELSDYYFEVGFEHKWMRKSVSE